MYMGSGCKWPQVVASGQQWPETMKTGSGRESVEKLRSGEKWRIGGKGSDLEFEKLIENWSESMKLRSGEP